MPRNCNSISFFERRLVPDFILRKCRENQFSGTFSASAMFVDIAGFTAITQRLMAESTEGAEVLARIINDIFTPAIHAVYQNQGYVSAFAGDAFTALFPGKYAKGALPAAQAIRDLFATTGHVKTRFGEFQLAVTIGLSAGSVAFRILDAEVQKVYYFRGPAIDGCSQAERHAEAMQIVADTAFVRQLSVPCDIQPGTGCWHVLRVKPGTMTIGDNEWPVPAPAVGQERFMPRTILDLQAAGEFREVVCCFINFRDTGGFQTAITQAITRCHAYGGYVNRVAFGDKGGLMLVLFGAPELMGMLFQRAVDFALSLRQLKGLEFRAGLASGIAFTGFVGSNRRAEYTAQGNVANLAARLVMQSKWRDVVVGPRLAKQLFGKYATMAMGSLALKGFAYKINAHRVQSKLVANEPLYAGEFIGRNREKRRLKELIVPIFKGRFAGIICIDGAAGIGKSRFIAHFCQNTTGCTCVYLPCDQILQEPFNPIISFFKRYFKQDSSSTVVYNRRTFCRIYSRLIDETHNREVKNELKRTQSLIGALLGFEWTGSIYETLDAKSRYENTLFALKHFFLAQALHQPLVIVLEDCHWIDADSAEWLKVMSRQVADVPLVVIALCRYRDDDSKFQLLDHAETDAPMWRLKMGPFNRQSIAELVSNRLRTGKLPRETLDFICEKSIGNPFFAEQVALYLHENKLLDSAFHLADTVALPAEISRIIIARIDRLSARMKATVKAASVLGRRFALDILQKLLAMARVVEQEDQCTVLMEAGRKQRIWENVSELHYIFTHALIRDAVYNMQLKDRLRELHQYAASIIEGLYPGRLKDHYSELADHFEKAENKEKAIEYLEKSAELAISNYQNEKAAQYYGRLLKYLDVRQDGVKWVHTVLTQGWLYELAGKWRQAARNYEEAQAAAERLDVPSLVAACIARLGSMQRKKGNLEKAMRLLKRSHRIALHVSDKKGINAVVSEMATVYSLQGRYAKAVALLKDVLRISRELGDDHAVVKAYNTLGIIHKNKGDFAAAMNCYQNQLAVASALMNKKVVGKIYGNMGIVYKNQGEYNRAMSCFNKQLAISREIGDKDSANHALLGFANIFLRQGKYRQAMCNLQEQLKISRELGDKRRISGALCGLGGIYARQRKYAEALECFQRDLAINRNMGDKKSICHALGNVGYIFLQHGKLDEAKKCFEEQLALSQTIGDRVGFCRATGNIGDVYLNQGDFSSALVYGQKYLSETEKLGMKADINAALHLLAAIYKDMREYSKSMKCAQRLLSLGKEIGDKESQREAHNAMGDLHYALRDFGKAAACYANAAEISAKLGVTYTLCRDMYSKARALYAAKKPEEADEANRKALILAEECKNVKTGFQAKILHSRIHDDIKGLSAMLLQAKKTSQKA